MITRRSLLKCLSMTAGSTALTPFIRHLQWLEHPDPVRRLPRRFVFVVKGSGLQAAYLNPVGLVHGKDRLIEAPLAKRALPDSLVPLDAFRDRLTIVQGLSGKMCSIGHSSFYGALGAYKASAQAPPRAATVDGFLAQRLPSVFHHIGLKMGTGSESTAYPSISAAGKNRQLPFQCDPQLAYMNLFGSIVDKGDIKKKYERTGSVLDFVSEEVKRLRAALPATEAERLDHYLAGFDTLKTRRHKLISMQMDLKQHAPALSDKYSSKVTTHHLEAHFDMATAALTTGLTNVATIVTDDLQSSYAGIGITPSVHSVGHGSSSGALSAQDCRNLIRTFHVQLIAGMARRLDAIPEGDGTMLDNTLIVYLSDNSNLHHSTAIEWPLVMLGGGGGRVKRGRYVAYPRHGTSAHHHTIGNFLTTLCHAAGFPVDHFGQPDLALGKPDAQRGPLPELLA